MKTFSLLIALLTSTVLMANDHQDKLSDSLILEQSIINSEVIKFRNDDKEYPELSQFKIIHSVSMSNERGERWATITIKNEAAGRRILKREHIMAIFADGERKFPISDEHSLESNETLSISFYFGKYKFPILKLLTRK